MIKRFAILMSFALSGCAIIPLDTPTPPLDEGLVIRPAARPGGTPPPTNARTAEDFDTTTDAERSAAISGGASGTLLGTTIASLGDVAEPGFWLETPLVDRVQQGKVASASGRTLDVELRPIGGDAGAGSRLSLAAMRLLNIPLTDLPEIRVYGG